MYENVAKVSGEDDWSVEVIPQIFVELLTNNPSYYVVWVVQILWFQVISTTDGDFFATFVATAKVLYSSI